MKFTAQGTGSSTFASGKDVLRNITLFHGCNDQILARLEADLVPATHQSQECILKEGDPADRLYCLLNGAAKITRRLSGGEEQIISLARPGEVLGLQALMHHPVFTSSAVAIQPTQGVYLSKSALKDALKEDPSLSLNILRSLCLEMDAVEDKIAGLTRKNSPQRIAEALLLLKEKFGTDERGYLQIQLTRKDLANLTHTTTSTLSRVLAQFRRQGILGGGRQIRICDPSRLNTLANNATR